MDGMDCFHGIVHWRANMEATSLAKDRERLFRVRPAVLLACFGILLVMLLPDAMREHRSAKWLLLTFGSLAVILGWFFYIRHHENNSKWREFIALITAVYLTASIPAYYFEFFPIKWLMRGPHWSALYVRPWVHWAFIFVYLSVAGSLLGRGRARIAFTTGSILLLILWEAMPRWIW
jgi:multisubunit Na+/H+ antiporter MnhG subunit